MADRVIRDELLTSERYWSVSIEAQRLFVHLILNVDDTGRFSGLNFTIRAACFPGQAIDPTKLEKLLEELHNADLVRLYSVDNFRFIFMPRFRQRLRFIKSKYPPPPSEINDIPYEKYDLRRAKASPEHDQSRAEASPKTAEVKRSEVKKYLTQSPATSAGHPDADISALNPENPRPSLSAGTNPRAMGTNPRALGTNPRARGTNPRAQRTPPHGYDSWRRSEADTLAKQQELGLIDYPGESWDQLRARIGVALKAKAKAEAKAKAKSEPE